MNLFFLLLLSGFFLVNSYNTKFLSKLTGKKIQQTKNCYRLKSISNLSLVTGGASSSSIIIQSATNAAILKLLSACSIGVYITKLGILDKNSLSVLSKLVFEVFQPCLLFVNVALTVSKARLTGDTSIMLLPLAALLQITTGFGLGKLISLIFYGKNRKSDDGKQLTMCTTFANSGPLPLVFTDSLFRNLADKTILTRSVAYISMYLLMWSPLFWSLGTMILGGSNSSLTAAQKRTQFLKRIFSPPIIGCLLGVVVGFVPFFQNLFLSPSGLFNPVVEAMRTLSAAYLPSVILVLGGSLLPKKEDVELVASSDPEDRDTTLKFIKRVLAVYAARFLLMPMLALTTIRFIKTAFPQIVIEPLLLFVLLLESCMPCAQNSTVILQLEKKSRSAASMARTLLAVYVLGVPAMSFWLMKILEETAVLV